MGVNKFYTHTVLYCQFWILEVLKPCWRFSIKKSHLSWIKFLNIAFIISNLKKSKTITKFKKKNSLLTGVSHSIVQFFPQLALLSYEHLFLILDTHFTQISYFLHLLVLRTILVPNYFMTKVKIVDPIHCTIYSYLRMKLK